MITVGPGDWAEAANKGAQEAGGISVGLNIDLPFEQTHNEFIDSDKLIDFDYFLLERLCSLICPSFYSYARWFWHLR